MGSPVTTLTFWHSDALQNGYKQYYYDQFGEHYL